MVNKLQAIIVHTTISHLNKRDNSIGFAIVRLVDEREQLAQEVESTLPWRLMMEWRCRIGAAIRTWHMRRDSSRAIPPLELDSPIIL